MTYTDQDGATATYTTANGTACDDVYVDADGVVDDYHRLRALVPRTLDPAFPTPVVVFLHGVAGDEDSLVDETRLATVRDAWLDNGWLVVGPRYGGAKWGNQLSVDGLDAIFDHWVSVDFTPFDDGVLVYGASMGGIGGLNWHRLGTTSILAFAGNSPSYDLEAAYDGLIALQSSIENTYSFTGPPFDAVATAGFNPADEPASTWAGLPIRLWASDSDGTINKTDHADAFATLLSAHDAEFTNVTVIGGHLSDFHYLPDETARFFQRALSDNIPTAGATGGRW